MKRVAKIWIKISTASMLMAIIVLSLACCTVNTPFDVEGKKQDFFALSLDELKKFVTVGEYKNLDIQLGDATREEAVWAAIIAGSTVHKYPEEHVFYYTNQFKGQYRYYAEKAGMTYEDILKELGESEATILERSKLMAKKDVLVAEIAKIENIVITDAEKTTHFDKYVAKYVSEYGYDAEYVTENMTNEILDSMLYDKIMEFLILNNNIL